MTRKLTFGYLYDFRNPVQWRRPWVDMYAETLEFITWTEKLGFEAAWVSEHHGVDDGYMPSPLIALAAIATRTRRLKLGTAVALQPMYHPVRFAEDCAIVDLLSNGRFEATLGLGYRKQESDAYGIDHASRGSRMDEFLTIVRRLWAGERVSFEGRHFNLTAASISPLPCKGNIPLFLGGYSDKTFERVLAHADGLFGDIGVCDLFLEKLRGRGVDVATTRIRAVDLFLAVARDPDEAWHELAPYFLYMNNMYGRWLSEDKSSVGLPKDVLMNSAVLDEFKASGKLRVLTPGEAISMFKALCACMPAEHLMMAVPPGVPLSLFSKYAELFAREVLPAFR